MNQPQRPSIDTRARDSAAFSSFCAQIRLSTCRRLHYRTWGRASTSSNHVTKLLIWYRRLSSSCRFGQALLGLGKVLERSSRNLGRISKGRKRNGRWRRLAAVAVSLARSRSNEKARKEACGMHGKLGRGTPLTPLSIVGQRANNRIEAYRLNRRKERGKLQIQK